MATQIIIQNPFGVADDSDNDDDVSASSHSSLPHTPTTAQPPSGFRAQLNHLLPRHAFFHVHIHIHRITNIPLVSGEFAIKWKFKNAHGLPGAKSGSGLLGGFKAKRRARKEGRLRADITDATELGTLLDVNSQRTNSLDGHASVWSGASSTTSSSSSSASSSAPKSTNTRTTSSSASSAPALPPSIAPPTTPAHGQTPFLRLKDHAVAWEHTLSILIRMDVDRDPQSMLLSCPLKLTVLQRDQLRPDAKPVPFGVVMLDLAQYASKGEVQRRYLLRESKTNATLKLTTQLTHLPSTHAQSNLPPPPSTSVSASPAHSTSSVPAPAHHYEHHHHHTSNTTNTFTAPPLPNGEILNGITSILQGASLVCGYECEMFRSRPRGLEMYGPYYDQEELEFDLFGGRAAPKGKNRDKGKGKEKDRDKDKEPKNLQEQGREPPTPTPRMGRERSATQSFDPSKLPLAYGARTTEALIEALFNPVETRHVEKESPFTVLVSGGGADPQVSVGLSPPLSSINSSSSSSSSGSRRGLGVSPPPASFVTTTPRSGISSETTTSGSATVVGPRSVPHPPAPYLSSRSTSASSYLPSSGSRSSSSSGSTPVSAASATPTPAPPTIYNLTVTKTQCTPPNPNPESKMNSSSSSSSPPHPLARSNTSASTKSTKSFSLKKRPQRAGSTGIGAGLGIMGLGMGMGVGMGVGVGVSGRRTSVDGDAPPPSPVTLTLGVEEPEPATSGVKAWFRKAKGPSRPPTPTLAAMSVAS
ncbi:hypothetical protein H0H92_011856 [Tricholoma furcatifolium]|nr:hypothetical protein H0H92_011856 [Tricholoma furcatifolium]